MPMNQYAGEPTANTGRSPALWADQYELARMIETGRGYRLNDDFLLFKEDTGGWAVGGTNETTVVPADELGGVVTIGATGADKDEGYMTSGNNEGGFCKIYSTTPKELWYEARIKVSSILDQAGFVGLSEEGLAGADTLTDDDGDLGNFDFLGFHFDNAGPATVDFVYRKAGSAAVVMIAGADTLVAGTWVKLGFQYDGKYLKCYVDGVLVEIDSTVTGYKAQDGMKIADATNFPDGEILAALFGIKDGAGAAKTMPIDWVDCVQER